MDLENLQPNLTTYNTGIIQARAYRALRITISTALKKYNLTMSEWALLGTIHDKRYVRYSELAGVLEVKPPLVTKIIDGLIIKELVSSVKDKEDKRSKLLTETSKASALVPQIELDVRTKTRNLIKEISSDELITYVKVLKALAENLKDVK